MAQSAEFSQMLVSFEFEVQTTTGQIICNTLIDNQRCLSVESPNLHGAQQSALSSLLNKLCATQPVVGLIFSREGKVAIGQSSAVFFPLIDCSFCNCTFNTLPIVLFSEYTNIFLQYKTVPCFNQYSFLIISFSLYICMIQVRCLLIFLFDLF